MSSDEASPRPVRWAILGTGSIANDMVRFGVGGVITKEQSVIREAHTLHTCSLSR